jgi:hypothetical protein
MKFFYRYVNRLKEPDAVSTDIDPAMLGNILHEIMRRIYQPYTGSMLSHEIIEKLLKNRELLTSIVDEAVNDKFKAGRNELIGGNELIVRDVLMAYLKKVLSADKTIAPLTILNLEDTFVFDLPVLFKNNTTNILTGGNVDRIDKIGGVTRIVDYKTGTVSESVSSISDLFIDDRKKDPDAWLQTLLYCEAYLVANPGSNVRPSVYKIKKLNASGFADKLKLKPRNAEISIDDYSIVRDEFIDGIKVLIHTIFSEDEPFVKTKDARNKCVWCPYRILCAR